MTKSYLELSRLETFEERYEYLRIGGVIGQATFGFERYLNQTLYHSTEWLHTKRGIVLRDNGCDLGIPGLDIRSGLLVHHINPLSMEDLEDGADCIFDPNNLITTTLATHNAIHYGNSSLLPRVPVVRRRNDTCPWA